LEQNRKGEGAAFYSAGTALLSEIAFDQAALQETEGFFGHT
jgi:hypothetical protein